MAIVITPRKLDAVRNAIHQPRGAGFSVTRATASVRERNVAPSPATGTSPSSFFGR